MRILFVVHQFFPEFHSGTERVTLNLARAAQRAGHHVHVLGCAVQPDRFAGLPNAQMRGAIGGIVDGVPATMLARAGLPATADTSLEVDDAVTGEIRQWMQAQRFDVVHVMHTMRMGSAVAAAQQAQLPVVLTLTDFFLACTRINLIDVDGRPCRGPEQGRACARKCLAPAWSRSALQHRHELAHSLLAYASARIAPSEFVARRFRAAFADLEFDVLPHGVDLLAMVRARSAAPPPRAQGGERRIAYIGTIIPPKGLHVLLRALALVPELPLALSVLGTFHDDEQYEAQVRSLAAADGRVTLLGRRSADEVAALLHGVDLLCLPSLVPESFSLVLHEAAALGVPSLVSDRGAPADVIRATQAGAVVPADDPRDWAVALRKWVDDPQLAAGWRRAVRLPLRVEEEAFLYEGLYRQSVAGA
ncbi:MAG: glycosyltransferase [Rubrivivax sp.]|nr:glycosyltransferase [Rubrivivax sp.]